MVLKMESASTTEMPCGRILMQTPISLIRSDPIDSSYDPDNNLIIDIPCNDNESCSCRGKLVKSDLVVDANGEWKAADNNMDDDDDDDDVLTAPMRKSLRRKERLIEKKLVCLREIAERTNLAPRITDKAAVLLQFACKNEAIKHRLTHQNASAAACLFIASREEGVPRSFKELCKFSGCHMKQIARHFKLISTELQSSQAAQNSAATTSCEDFIPRFVSCLKLPGDLHLAAVHVAQNKAQIPQLMGRSPITVAAAAIYAAVNMTSYKSCSLDDIARVTRIKSETIVQSYKLILPCMARMCANYVRNS